MEGQCPNPTCTHSVITSDYTTGDRICRCGCVVGRVYLVAHSYKSIFTDDKTVRRNAPPQGFWPVGAACVDEPPPDYKRFPKYLDQAEHIEGAKKNSAPYKRRTYCNERLSQWRRQEPPVPPMHMLEIKLTYVHDTDFDTDYLLTKEDISVILSKCKAHYGGFPYGTKYLEKWISIRHELQGIKGSAHSCTDMHVHEIRDKFIKVEKAFTQLLSHVKSRRSMISYNFVFRRIFDLMGHPEWGLDFPVLKNSHKRVEVTAYWLHILHYLTWPYINSDEDNFGEERGGVNYDSVFKRYGAISREWNDRGNRTTKKRKRREPTPEPEDDTWLKELIAEWEEGPFTVTRGGKL